MSEKATCATCPWWVFDREASGTAVGDCRHVTNHHVLDFEPTSMYSCSAHPDRKLPDVHELAALAMRSLINIQAKASPDELPVIAYEYADAMLAEAKRRQGPASEPWMQKAVDAVREVVEGVARRRGE